MAPGNVVKEINNTLGNNVVKEINKTFRTSYQTKSTSYIREMNIHDKGEQDAFSHCFSSAASTEEYGETISNLLGQANEWARDWTIGNPTDDKNKDLYNNSIGRSIAKEAKNEAESKKEGGKGDGEVTEGDLAKRCREALNKGKLITNSKKDPRKYEDPPSDGSAPNNKREGISIPGNPTNPSKSEPISSNNKQKTLKPIRPPGARPMSFP